MGGVANLIRVPLIAALMCCFFLSLACGGRIEPIGEVLNHVGLRKELVEESPADLTTAEYASQSSYSRVKHADVLDGDSDESLIEVRPMRGVHKGGVEIRDDTRRSLVTVLTPDYLTDFGAVRASRPDKLDLVIYTYPNGDGGGTFSVLTLPSQTPVATWTESSPPTRFVVGDWNGVPALFYLLGDMVQVRSAFGSSVARLPLPGAGSLSRIHVVTVSPGLKVFLLSGDGYTPYHIVAVFNENGDVVFHENGFERAFALKATGAPFAFDVWTRSGHWRYSPVGKTASISH